MKTFQVKYFIVSSFVILTMFLFVACMADEQNAVSPQDAYPNPAYSSNISSCSPGSTMKLGGWLSVIRNGQTHYFLQAQSGQKWELLLDSSVLQSVGGAVAIDRKFVIVEGQCASKDSYLVTVLAIKLGTP